LSTITDTVAETVQEDRCISCGVCSQVCPSDAITIIFDSERGSYVPIVETSRCTHCGLCKEVCFGATTVSSSDYPMDINDYLSILGTHVECYFGFATDQEARFKATSGGIVTTLLHFLFDQNRVDGAIVAGIGSGTLPLAKSFIAKNKDELDSAMGSKYCPVVLNKALASIEPNKRYVMVGLPCHIYAVKQLAKFNKKIANAIKFYIGLFCGGTFSYNKIWFKRQTLSTN
jgi:coenzyme F420 hydrogenase subunit beta